MRFLKHIFFFILKEVRLFVFVFPKNVFSWVNILLDIYFVPSPVIKIAWRKLREKLFLFLISSTIYKLVKLGFILADGGKVNWREL